MSALVLTLLAWAAAATLAGILGGRIIRNLSEAEMAVPLDVDDAADEPGPIYPVLYPLGVTVQSLVNMWPDGQLVPIGMQGYVVGVTSSRGEEPTYHVRWDNGAMSLLSESAMDADVAVLHRMAA